MSTTDIIRFRYPSPAGELCGLASGTQLFALAFADQWSAYQRYEQQFPALRDGPMPAPVQTALDGYFNGQPQAFEALELMPQGSDFQQKVWQSLLLISWGETRSYRQQAEALGDVAAIRAVAAANGRNPIGIAIPCHRVIGSDGSLTGYAGGLDRKAWLLEHEGLIVGRQRNKQGEFSYRLSPASTQSHQAQLF